MSPLKKEVEWLRQIEAGTGEVVFKIAQSLLEGKNGYPKDIVLADDWLHLASYRFDYVAARYPLAKLMRDPDNYEIRRKYYHALDREADLRLANYILVSSATQADHRADALILALLHKAPDYPRKDWALYYFLRRLDRRGMLADRSELEQVRARLPEHWRGVIERWKSDSPPFTRLGATE